MPLLRLRSDEQLVSQFRGGDEDAFRVIHDRYRQRLFAYTRQMLASRQDAEDALQDVFVRAYAGLRSSDRDLALRAWLYRVAHNRCVDELRRPPPPAPELITLVRPPIQDPIAQAEQRESLRRLIADVRRLPDQQRSALLMRELTGMSYTELAAALGISVPALKSLLVRARVSLVQSMQARDTACTEIRQELVLAHDRRRRPEAIARRHLRDCAPCREFRGEIRGVSRQLGALLPLGPAGMLANLLGFGGGAGGGAAAGTGAAAGGGTCVASGLLVSGAGHVATLLAAAAVTAGGAVEIQHSLASPTPHSQSPPAIRYVPTSRSASSPLLPTPSPSAPSTPPSSDAPAAATNTEVPPPRGEIPRHGRETMAPPGPPQAAAATGSNPPSPASLETGIGSDPTMSPDPSTPAPPAATDPAASAPTDPASGSATGSATGAAPTGAVSSTSSPSGTTDSATQASSGPAVVPAISDGSGSAGSPSAEGSFPGIVAPGTRDHARAEWERTTSTSGS